MNKGKYYKYLFFFGGCYNLIALLMFVFLTMIDGFLPFLGMENPPSLLFANVLGTVIGALAIAYFMLSKDISKNHGLIEAGAVGRTLAFVIVLIYSILGHCNWILPVLLSADLLQAALYVEFLINHKKL
jgi:hypothetical protein